MSGGGGGGQCGLIYITQRNLNSSAQLNRLNKSLILESENSAVFIAFSRRFGFKDDPEGIVQHPLRISTVDYHGGRIAFHFLEKTLQRRERNENTEHLPAADDA